jgi:hypothetical protein
MKIFISWSGDESKAVATALQRWLKLVIPSPDIFLSSESLDPGVRWSDQVGRSLQETNYGIICLTPTNLESPWVLFEAGAISKIVDGSHVTPLLYRVKKTNVTGPLALFQMIDVAREDLKGLAESINGLSESPKDKETLENIIELAWPQLQQDLAQIPADDDVVEVQRPDRELLEEILSVVRGITSLNRLEALNLQTATVDSYNRDLRERATEIVGEKMREDDLEKVRAFAKSLEDLIDTPFRIHTRGSDRRVVIHLGPHSIPSREIQVQILARAKQSNVMFGGFRSEIGSLISDD